MVERQDVDAEDNVKVEHVGIETEGGQEVGLILSLQARINGSDEWVGQLLEPEQAKEVAKDLYARAKEAETAEVSDD